MGQLAVKIVGNESREEIIWQKHGNQGYFWKSASISINKNSLYQVCFYFTENYFLKFCYFYKDYL